MRQPGGALPEDLFTPRAHELLLVLAPPLGPAAAGAPNEATWASRARVAPEGALGQRPASWPRDEGPLPMSNPTTPVPYNKGFPDAPPPFGTVDAAAWGSLCAALHSGSDELCDPYFVNNTGIRIWDARTGIVLALQRGQMCVAKLTGPIKVPAFLLFFIIFPILTFVIVLGLGPLTYLLEGILFGLLRIPAALCCGVPDDAPLPGIGAEARNAAHLAGRVALIDNFAKAHGLVISYEHIEYIGWKPAVARQSKAAWIQSTAPVLRVRRVRLDGPPAGLLRAYSSMV